MSNGAEDLRLMPHIDNLGFLCPEQSDYESPFDVIMGSSSHGIAARLEPHESGIVKAVRERGGRGGFGRATRARCCALSFRNTKVTTFFKGAKMRNRSIYGGLFFFGLVAAPLVACSLGSDDRPTGDNLNEAPLAAPTVIHPDGSDLPGRFKVLAPNGAPADSKVISESASGRLNAELGPFPVGGRKFRINSGGLSSPEATIQIASNQVTTIKTGLVAIDGKNAPPTVGLSPVAGFPTPYVGTSIAGNSVHEMDGTKPGAVLPGTYSLSFGLYDGVTFTVRENETTTVQAWDYTQRRRAKIVAPVREFSTPTCVTGYGVSTPGYHLVTEPYGASTELSLENGKAAELGKSASARDIQIKLSMVGVYGEALLPYGELGADPLAFTVGRLDVDDVAVRQSDGSVKMVRGSYNVYPMVRDSAGEHPSTFSVVCYRTGEAVPTRTGVDLLPGRYQVVVRYSTIETGPKTDVHIVDI